MSRRYGKLKVPHEDVALFAAKVGERHDQLIAKGYRLAASSGFWQLKDKTITARFVYRARNMGAGNSFTITETITGLRRD